MVKYNNLFEMFKLNAQKFKKKVFITFEDKSYTYQETEKIISRVSRVFLQHGVQRGTKVVVMLNNSPEFVFSIFAIWACGAIAIPMNVFFKSSEASYVINDSQAEFFLTSKDFIQVIQGVKEQCPNLIEIFSYDDECTDTINIYKAASKLNTSCLLSPVTINDVALYIYTSGTTGNVKGAVLTHYNLLHNLFALSNILCASKKDKFLIMLPMFHAYTFTTCVMLPVYLGASMIILASAMEMRKTTFKKILLFKRPTLLMGVPQIFLALIKAAIPNWFIKLFYPIKIHISGGASLPLEVLEQFKKKFGVPIIEGYGLSEASPVVAFNPIDKQKAGTVGLALPNVKVKIVNAKGKSLPIGQVGQLIIKSGSVMQGYWNMPQATKDVLRHGWLFTGDLAKIDQEGYITIVDRQKDVIITKGMNVYPSEVESVIYSFPDVEVVAVIGVPSLGSGEVIHAYIQPKPGKYIDEKALKVYLSQKLANFKLPKVIRIVPNIPLTATGKVLKRALKTMLKEGRI